MEDCYRLHERMAKYVRVFGLSGDSPKPETFCKATAPCGNAQSRDMIGVEMADLWTLVGAICILVETRKRRFKVDLSMEISAKAETKHDVAVPPATTSTKLYSVW